jgi:hypothetical protein
LNVRIQRAGGAVGANRTMEAVKDEAEGDSEEEEE